MFVKFPRVAAYVAAGLGTLALSTPRSIDDKHNRYAQNIRLVCHFGIYHRYLREILFEPLSTDVCVQTNVHKPCTYNGMRRHSQAFYVITRFMRKKITQFLFIIQIQNHPTRFECTIEERYTAFPKKAGGSDARRCLNNYRYLIEL